MLISASRGYKELPTLTAISLDQINRALSSRLTPWTDLATAATPSTSTARPTRPPSQSPSLPPPFQTSSPHHPGLPPSPRGRYPFILYPSSFIRACPNSNATHRTHHKLVSIHRKTRFNLPRQGLRKMSTLTAITSSTSPLASAFKKQKVAIIGSGNWGSAIARIAGNNALKLSDIFEYEVSMYVYEEDFNGKPLTQVINELHENPKYLPGIKLPENVVAYPSAAKAAEGATLLVFVLPHQFIRSVCTQLKGQINPEAYAISMIKGVEVKDGEISIFADVIEETLGVECAALSGANIANEVAEDKFSETTIGHREGEKGKEAAELFFKLFDTPTFKVGMIEDVAGVSLCGALKNVVAIAAGFTDGLGWGDNAKAAIMRIGLLEMKRFSEEFFKGVKPETFTETSAGVADLITTCFGGRNRKCAEAFVKTGKSFEVLEKELLNGQKLQGSETAREIHEFLKARGKVDDYPLFKAVYSIAYEGIDAHDLTSKL
ncbi:NAD-dependent glycerol-3-phosphate dehydrogenase [Violaceomyces palustris]|uniref:NAD-dependent glycerol-3-phosphate dehydrogenase n=1 Tax=Violaceomyces palustris TaxID=1673888 RepID=A0ACD0P7K4_9BASI|nr:NAD-dependent glycerol-3-phosphate dehydrogenase [Violaceomyces palustris]